MQIGDLVRWKSTRTDTKEFGVIVDSWYGNMRGTRYWWVKWINDTREKPMLCNQHHLVLVEGTNQKRT